MLFCALKAPLIMMHCWVCEAIVYFMVLNKHRSEQSTKVNFVNNNEYLL